MAMDYLFAGPYRFPNFNDTNCVRLNETCGIDINTLKSVLLPTDCDQFISNVKFMGKKLDCKTIFSRKNSQGICFTANSFYLEREIASNVSHLVFNREEFLKGAILEMDLIDLNEAQLQVIGIDLSLLLAVFLTRVDSLVLCAQSPREASLF